MASSAKNDDVTQRVMNEMFERFQNENKKLVESIHVTIHEAVQKEFILLHNRLDDQEARLFDAEFKNKSQAEEIQRLSTIVTDQRTTMNNLRLSVAELDQYSRRNCLQIFGVEEQVNESTDDIICQLARDSLGVTISKDDIDRSHRVGDPNKQPKRKNGKPERRARPIVVKFTSYRTRHAVISRRRRLKGTDVAIQEQLTKANLQLLKSVKKIKNVLTAWSSDGRVIAKLQASNGKTINRAIRDESDLHTLELSS